MKKIFEPKKFLNIKVLSPLENSKIFGGLMDVDDDKQKQKKKQKQKQKSLTTDLDYSDLL